MYRFKTTDYKLTESELNIKYEKGLKILLEKLTMDFRLLIVLLPLMVAGGWAFYNIGKIAIAQVQNFLNKEA